MQWKLWWALKKSLAARRIGAVPWPPAAKSLSVEVPMLGSRAGMHGALGAAWQ